MPNQYSMMNKKSLVVLMFTFATFLASLSIEAKDIADEQYQVRMAQKEFDSANQDYEVLSGSIKELEKRIAQQTQQLNELKKNQPIKEERLKKAQLILNGKQAILDKAWEENKK